MDMSTSVMSFGPRPWEIIDLDMAGELPLYYPIDTNNNVELKTFVVRCIGEGVRTVPSIMYMPILFLPKKDLKDLEASLYSDTTDIGDEQYNAEGKVDPGTSRKFTLDAGDVERIPHSWCKLFGQAPGELRYRLLNLSCGKREGTLKAFPDDGGRCQGRTFWVWFPDAPCAP